MSFSPETYRARRNALAEKMKTGIALIPTAKEVSRNSDVHFPFRPDSYFYYLTGFKEPDAVLVVISGEKPKSILFMRPKDPMLELWGGERLGPERALKELGVEEAYALDVLDTRVTELIRTHRNVYADLEHDKGNWGKKVLSWIENARPHKTIKFPYEIHDVRIVLAEMRMVKDPEEIEIMRRTCEVSAKGHVKAMETCRPGLMEYQLETIVTSHFRWHGGDPLHAYPPIVAGGNNACTLHYVKNDCALIDGDLVLIDAGSELDGYAGDVTRTFPVNGRFTSEQKALYKIVLEAQLSALKKVCPGNTVQDVHKEAVRVITRELLNIGILKGNIKTLIKQNDRGYFFPHGVGHWLGLDVHDAGYYIADDRKKVLLEPGMILTVEPGIYIPKGSRKARKMWHGIGIRIEDDVLVTSDGHEVLTSFAPKTTH